MLYPPILTSAQPVFSFEDPSFSIDFAFPSYADSSEVKSFDVIVAQQSNNRSIIKSEDGSGIYSISYNNAVTSITIECSNFKSKLWKVGYLYKVQLRAVDENGNRSEWSNVAIIKPIKLPTLRITKERNTLNGKVELVSSLTPTFFGYCTITKASHEIEQSYRFILKSGDTILEDLGWQTHSTDKDDVGYFTTVLQQHASYTVVYRIRTNNGYEGEEQLTFVAIQTTIGDLGHIAFTVQGNPSQACIELALQTEPRYFLDGNYVIARSSSLDNYQHLEDIQFLYYFSHQFTDSTVVFRDYTIESGVTYKYSFQFIDTSNLRSNALLTSPISVDFDDIYLYRDNIQLKLRCNNNISSFKHTVLRNKQDTIGDKYPHLVQNGNAYYAEFSLSGLITYQDNNDSFFVMGLDENVYYKDKLVLEREKFEPCIGKRELSVIPSEDNGPFNHKSDYFFNDAATKQFYAYSNDLAANIDRRDINEEIPTLITETTNANSLTRENSISYDLTHNNIYIERRFREKVEEFLNDFNYKLFKSPTEGNCVISLMNVTLKPETALGRMIYEFSATAYEILENTLEELDTYGIINIGSITEILDEVGEFEEFNQIELYGKSNNRPADPIYLTGRINTQVANMRGENYTCSIKKINRLWIELLPLPLLQERYATWKDADGKAETRWRTWQTINYPFKIQIGEKGGEEILIPLQQKKVYTIINPPANKIWINDLRGPIFVNYECTVRVQRKTSPIQTVGAPTTTFNFNQIYGIFMAGTDLLSEIVNKIKQDTGWISDNGDGSWKGSGNVAYRLEGSGLNSIDIESDIGTEFSLGESNNSYTNFKIGYNLIDDQEIKARFESNRIFFPNVLSHAGYFQLNTTAHVIINFSYYLETVTDG